MILCNDTERRLYPSRSELIPDLHERAGRYELRFARTAADLDAILRLRFEVFNLELGEGLDASYARCRDEDAFDLNCHHLMVIERRSREVIGTYRMQTWEMAQAGIGFYSAGEFDLAALPEPLLMQAVELGRACIAREHRNSRVLFLLWRGLAAYVFGNRRRYFFGCCSLTSQDPVEGMRVMRHLETQGLLHAGLELRPQPGFECCEPVAEPGEDRSVKLPRLMQLYLSYGARIVGPPAIDRLFKTIDFLAWFDVHEIDARTRGMFVD